MKANRNTSATQWLVPPGAAMTAAELSFIDFSAPGSMWWAVTPPKTHYTQAHGALGRVMAFELLDYLRNPDAEPDPEILGRIAQDMIGERHDTCRGAMIGEFFATLSRYMAGEPIDR